MKKLELLLALSFIAPLAGCPADDGSDDGANTDPTTTATDPTTTSPTTTSPTTTSPTTTSPTTTSETDPDTGTETVDPDTGTETNGELACVHTCAADGDCTMGGTDIGYICTDGSCLPEVQCMDDAFCVAQLSAWSAFPCTMGGGECDALMRVCVDLGDGTGGCAAPADGVVDCATMLLAEVEATSLDDGMPVTVCGQDRARCNMDGEFNYCESPCEEDAHCAAGWTCDTGSGVCQCAEDSQCGENGMCVDGACQLPGCMSDADCTNTWDGGTIACQ